MTDSGARAGAVLAVLLVGLSCAAGCERDGSWSDPGPAAEFRNFLMHWFRNEREKAFDMIDRSDRDRLTEPLGKLRERLDESALPERNEMLVAGRVDNPYDVKSIDVTPELESAPAKGDRVELELAYQDGRSGSVTMVWRGDGWYVDLPESETENEARSAADERSDTGGKVRGESGRDAGNRGTSDVTSGERQD